MLADKSQVQESLRNGENRVKRGDEETRESWSVGDKEV